MVIGGMSIRGAERRRGYDHRGVVRGGEGLTLGELRDGEGMISRGWRNAQPIEGKASGSVG